MQNNISITTNSMSSRITSGSASSTRTGSNIRTSTNSTGESSLSRMKVNPAWAKLALFDRKRWEDATIRNVRGKHWRAGGAGGCSRRDYVGLDDLDSGDLHIKCWGKGSDVIGTKLRFRKDDIIFGRRRAYQRKLAVAEFDGICSAHAMVVRAKPDLVMPEFLPFLMMSDKFMKRAVEISVGSLSPTINWKTMKLEEFALPPLNQQRRIAEILTAADRALESWRAAIKQHAATLFSYTSSATIRGLQGGKLKALPLARFQQLGAACRLSK